MVACRRTPLAATGERAAIRLRVKLRRDRGAGYLGPYFGRGEEGSSRVTEEPSSRGEGGGNGKRPAVPSVRLRAGSDRRYSGDGGADGAPGGRALPRNGFGAGQRRGERRQAERLPYHAKAATGERVRNRRGRGW